MDFVREAGHIFCMAIAFKEWALVCLALERGLQSMILRKGGIAEGKGGFGFDHAEFYLFPTRFHGQSGKVRIPDAVLPPHDPERVTISHAVTLEWAGRVADRGAVQRLEPLHVLDQSVVSDRFVYDTGAGSLGGAGINVALVRVFRLERPVVLPMEKSFGGCRSWIEVPLASASARVPVLHDGEHARRKELFFNLLGVSG
jgi:hypothetical protein